MSFAQQAKRMSSKQYLTQRRFGSLSKTRSAMFGTSMSTMNFLFRTITGGLKIPLYQNTYYLGPRKRFCADVADRILKDVMNDALTNVKYNRNTCLQLCKSISVEVRNRIYKRSYDRYKYFVLITIIQKSNQGMQSALGCLYDKERDNYSFHVMQTTDFIAIGVVGATYYE